MTRSLPAAVGPRLRVLLWVVFALAALLGANSLYLTAVSFLDWYSANFGAGAVYQNYFYYLMFLGHLGLGLLLVLPLLVFLIAHLRATRSLPNRRAAQMGYLLLAACGVLLLSGLALVRIDGLPQLRAPTMRRVVYWLHVAAPLTAVWLYWLHRLAGPPIRWRVGGLYLSGAAAFAATMVFLHSSDPREWGAAGPPDPHQYFSPSLTRTSNGNYIPAHVLMMDHYCRDCHPDAHRGWASSAHRFSSFNNPAYLFSIRETRKTARNRDGSVKASRWCAGCHDPVPLLSGAFSRDDYDMQRDPTAHAGITCTVCHAITSVNSVRGNGDYTIEEPQHYPFAGSSNRWLRFINHQLIKAKPALHKRTFLKPLHKTAKFCSTCHKVSLPREVTHYKDFQRGQNHYDSFLLSGVSGHGAQSFYYPAVAESNCNGCHMRPQESGDFGAKDLAADGRLSIHNHLFLGANTAVSHWARDRQALAAHQKFLRGSVRIDLFGIREGSRADGRLHAPLRPDLLRLQPGKSYVLEVVVRTLTLGHHFTEGTVDSNQVWLEVTARAGDRLLGSSGRVDEDGRVDPWSMFLNAYVLDRQGRRIDRRNAQDIFTKLYDHQIPPGAARVTHYRLDVPADVRGPIELEAAVRFRKFDSTYMRHVFGADYRIDLPITTLARDRVRLPTSADAPLPAASTKAAPIPVWQRWNDYGIGLFLEGVTQKRPELGAAADAFREVEKQGRYDGPLNLARVQYKLGNLSAAAAALQRAQACDPPAPRWVVAWINGQIQSDRGNLSAAIASYRSILTDDYPELRRRGFDFSKDYRVHNELGLMLFEQSKRKQRKGQKNARQELLRQAVATFERTLQLDSENAPAHHNLSLLYAALENPKAAAHHRRLRDRYRPHEDAGGTVAAIARQRDAAANHAADGIVIYALD